MTENEHGLSGLRVKPTVFMLFTENCRYNHALTYFRDGSMLIYHNPRCSKSRQTLALIEDQGISPEIVLYLDTPPSVSKIKSLLNKLGIPARELLRKGEPDYKDLGLADKSMSNAALIKAMHEYPKLIERPIVIDGERAILGRPPENVTALF